MNPNVTRRIEVEGEVCAADGGSDAAYDLCGTFTVEEFLSLLGDTLRGTTVRDMLLRGGNVPVGHVLRLAIRDADPPIDPPPAADPPADPAAARAAGWSQCLWGRPPA